MLQSTNRCLLDVAMYVLVATGVLGGEGVEWGGVHHHRHHHIIIIIIALHFAYSGQLGSAKLAPSVRGHHIQCAPNCAMPYGRLVTAPKFCTYLMVAKLCCGAQVGMSKKLSETFMMI
jgi:hypothetical protein